MCGLCTDPTRATQVGVYGVNRATRTTAAFLSSCQEHDNKIQSSAGIFLNKNVPKHIEQNMSTALAATLNRHAWERSDIDSCAIHPGGKNVLGAFTNALEADQESIQPSFDILSKYGNMSSCSVVFVLEQILREKRSKSGIYAAAFGPGLTVESAILKAIH
ncbi:MAG TPA: hypothetical protein DCX14_12575 [Flavobacteriales bacterium]|nr:hypothetical protein [Flavobacteriales bacterium]